MKILLVDDDDRFRARLAGTLVARGLEAYEASSVEEAREKIQSDLFDGYIFDLRMPGELGLNLITNAKDRSPHAKIIILTGYGSISTATNAIKLGATDFLTKPVKINQILEALGLESPQTEKSIDKIPSLDEVEKEYLNRVLNDFGGNVSRTAKALGLHRRSLQRKLL